MGGSPARARMFSIPASWYWRSSDTRSSGWWAMQVRWAMAVMPASRWMWTTMSRVRSRVEPPAP